jgi:hypothetical protein
MLKGLEGKWIFDAKLYKANLLSEASTEGEKKQIEERFKQLAQQKIPVHEDIDIKGTRIIGSGLVPPQYDLFNLSVEEGKITGKAVWHEDRHDPGDACTVDVVLYVEKKTLHFRVGLMGMWSPYVFRRPE